MMKADPTVKDVEVDDRVGLLPENDVMESHGLKFIPVQPIGGECADKKDVVHDRADRRHKFCRGCTREGIPVYLDNPGERKCNVEDRYPGVGFVFHMTCDRPFIWIDAHEELARLREQLNKLPVMGQELLDGLVVAEVPEVREHRHEAFGLERKRVHINLCRRVSGVGDSFSLDLVGEKRGDDGEESVDDVVLTDNVEGDGWYGEKLEGEVLDRGFGLAVHKQVGVNDPMVNISKMGS